MSASVSSIGSPAAVAGRTLAAPRARVRGRIPSVRRNLNVVIPGAFLLLVLVITVLAPVIAPYDPNELNMSMALTGPSGEHWLGTDQLGRDQLSRLIYGGQSTLYLAVMAVIATVTIGTAVGLVSGYFGGKLDLLTSSILNMLLALPSLLLTLAILGIMGPGTRSFLVALVASGWVVHARVIRSAVLALREQLYIEAAVSMGAKPMRVLARHLVPNLVTTVVILATLDIGVLILTITSLSFLGLGVQPPTPDWGTMLNDARPYFSAVPLLVIVPGVTIAAIVLAANLLGDGLRDLVDHGRRTR
jgi:peptide/nickel transport system permease protein